MAESSQNIDLQQQASKEFELQDVKKLLKKLKSGPFKIDENSFKNLDKDDNKLSETEKKLYEQSKEALNLINFLKGIVLELEKKEKSKTSGMKGWEKDVKLGPLGENKIHNKKLLKEKKSNIFEKLNNEEKKFNKITKKYSNLSELLNNKDDRRKILELNWNYDTCPQLKFKNYIKEPKNPEEFSKNSKNMIALDILKNKILEKEKNEIKNLLQGYTNKDGSEIDIKKTLFVSKICKPINLIQKLSGLKGPNGEIFTAEQIKKVLDGTANIKKLNAKDRIDEILRDKGINRTDLKGKSYTEIQKFLKNKGIDENVIIKVIKELDIIKETEKAQKINISNILDGTMADYNNLSIEFYNLNPESIKNITDFNKLKEVLTDKDFKNKNKSINLFHIDDSLHTIKTLELLFDEGYIKENSLGIINTKNLSLADFIKGGDISVGTFLSTLFDNTNIGVNFKVLSLFRKEALSRLIYKNKIDIFKMNAMSKIAKGKGFNILSGNIKKIIENMEDDSTDLPLEIINKLKNGKVNIDELSKENKFNINKLDNYLTKNFNMDTVLSIFKNSSITELKNYPKLLNKILSSPENINKSIISNPNFYIKFLTNKEQKEYNKTYLDSIIKLKASNKISFIERINFYTIEEAINIFKKLDSAKINLSTVLDSRILKDKLLKIAGKKDIDTIIKNLPKEKQQVANKIIKNIIEYKKNLINKNKELVTSFKENLKKSKKIDSNKKNEHSVEFYKKLYIEIDKKFKNSEIYEKLTTEEKGLSSALLYASAYEVINNENAGSDILIGELIKGGIDNKKFKAIMGLKLDVVKEESKKQDNELSKIKVKGEEDKKLLKKFLKKDGTPDILKIKNEFNTFIKIIGNNKEFKKLKYGTPEWKNKLLELFFNKENFNEIKNNELKSKIKQSLQNQLLIYKCEQEYENSEAYHKALKTGDYTEFNKLAEKSFYINLEKEEKKFKTSTSQQENQKTETTSQKTQNYDFNPETGIINFYENGKQEKITLTPAEKLLVQENPEIINNIINFHETLNELGLGKLWSIKENIFKSIENIKGVGFDIDGDYLNENEVKIFLNAILKSIGEQEISPIFNLNTFLSKIQTKNKIQIGGGEKIVNTYYGETYLENKFFEKFVGRNNTIIGFKQAEFEKSLKTNTQENVGKNTT